MECYSIETENPLEMAVPSAPYNNYSDRISEPDLDGSNRLQVIQTPKFGESYSQSGYSPVMQRSQGKTGTLLSNSSNSSSGGTMVKNGVPEGGTEEDDTEFMDNDAYETFTVPARFEIISKERGTVFETVKVK